MKQKVFNLIILDESGSMSSIARQAVDGVNETIQTIKAAQTKHEEQQHCLTLVTFNSDRVNTVCDNAPIEETEEFKFTDYRPSCCTPLYDAMGTALTKLDNVVEGNDAVLVTIITDGYENSSMEYDGKAIKALVESLKAKGWLFTYIGANQDVESFAVTISINNTLSFSADADGTKAMFAKERKSRERFNDYLACCLSDSVAERADFDYFADEESDKQLKS